MGGSEYGITTIVIFTVIIIRIMKVRVLGAGKCKVGFAGYDAEPIHYPDNVSQLTIQI